MEKCNDEWINANTNWRPFSGSEFEFVHPPPLFLVQGSHSWMMVDGSMSALVNTHICGNESFGNEYGDADTMIPWQRCVFGWLLKRRRFLYSWTKVQFQVDISEVFQTISFLFFFELMISSPDCFSIFFLLPLLGRTQTFRLHYFSGKGHVSYFQTFCIVGGFTLSTCLCSYLVKWSHLTSRDFCQMGWNLNHQV